MRKKKQFKNLNLNREKLPKYIREFCENEFDVFEVSEIKPVNDVNQYRCEIIGDNKSVMIDFYFKDNGATTIQPIVGNNIDISVKLASFILGKIEHKNFDNASYSVRNVDPDTFNFIVEYLNQLEGVRKINYNVNSHNRYVLYQFQGGIGDKLTLKYYDTQTLQVQGKPMYLYQEVTCLLADYYPFDEMIKRQAEFYSIDIQPAEVEDEMKLMLPNAYKMLDDTLKSILFASLAYKKIDINLPDYSSFVYPALRTLEGYMKQLLKMKGIVIKEFGEILTMVGKDECQLKPNIKAKICDECIVKAIEKCYNFYHIHRHSLFHTNSLDVTATRVIDEKNEADAIIRDVINLIESTYSSIVE